MLEQTLTAERDLAPVKRKKSLLAAIKQKVMRSSRAQKLEHFYAHFREGQTVLDVGVSAEKPKMKPYVNYFLKNFRGDLKNYTGLGIQDLSTTRKNHPGATLVQYPGGRFPFSDKQFDWIFSNAVIEHVGDEAAQLQFLNEMLRVARNVYFTTPAKFFPIEAHTNIFFLHWCNPIFYAWCRFRKLRHIRPDNLYLFSARRLSRLIARSNAAESKFIRNRTLGLTMTFTVITSSSEYRSTLAA